MFGLFVEDLIVGKCYAVFFDNKLWTFCSFQILRSDSNLKNSDAEIQQRALEYLKLSTVASPDVLVSYVSWCLLKLVLYTNNYCFVATPVTLWTLCYYGFLLS